MVSGDVPVLDSSGVLVGVLLVVGNVTDREDVFLPLDSKVLVDGDTLVFLQLESASLEELGGRSDTDSENEEVGRNVVGVLECYGTDLLRVGLCSDTSVSLSF